VKAKRLGQIDGQIASTLVFDEGDEAKSELERLARERNLTAAHFAGIGAFSELTLGYFDWNRKEYKQIPIHEQVEVATIAGDVAVKGDEPQVRAHIVVGDSDGRAYAGHLIEAHVRPTLELVLTETPAELRKRLD
jgi:hypothetical protein